MELFYACLRKHARKLALSYSLPLFYRAHTSEIQQSETIFDNNPLVKDIRGFVEKQIENDFGHGLEHAEKVTLDAGALVIVEAKTAGHTDAFVERRVILAQIAGMLHDMKRKKENHAELGSVFASDLLKSYPVKDDERKEIKDAIRNHEAFKTTIAIDSDEGRLLSDCLYDADKFQWGADNFITTLWDMVTFHNIPIEKFIKGYPKGLDYLDKIKHTFRTETGRKYGPEIIDIGLSIGKDLLKIILKECKRHY